MTIWRLIYVVAFISHLFVVAVAECYNLFRYLLANGHLVFLCVVGATFFETGSRAVSFPDREFTM